MQTSARAKRAEELANGEIKKLLEGAKPITGLSENETKLIALQQLLKSKNQLVEEIGCNLNA
jgi:hypothetical protein